MTYQKSQDDAQQWHLVYTKPRQEERAALNLEQQGFEVYFPLINSQVIRQGKIHHQCEPLFKRYIFVKFDDERSPWHVIRSTLGVDRLVRVGGELARVPQSLIDQIKAVPLQSKNLYEAGQLLKVKSGPFKDLEVIYQTNDGDARAFVLISMLQKIHQVSLPLANLSKVS